MSGLDSNVLRTGIFLILLAVIIAVLYERFLWNPLVFDDLRFFMVDEQGNSTLREFGDTFSPFQLRWLPYATLGWTAHWFGFDMINFRLGNLLLHISCALALFLFLRELFEAVLPKEQRPKDVLNLSWMAFFAALLFGLHPVATYGPGYLIQRTVVMATLFSLLAMYAYLRGRHQQNGAWLWASVLFYFLATYSKEHAITLVAVMVVLTIFLHADWIERLKRVWPIFAAYLVIAAFVVVAKKGLLGGVYEPNAELMLQEIKVGSAYTYPLSVLTQSWLFFKYWALWIFPNPAWMSIDMRELFAESLWSPYLLAFAAFIAYGFVALRLILKRGLLGLVGFALIYPWLMFMTEISTVRIQEGFVLYRSYIWAVGAFALLPFIIWKFSARGGALLLVVVAAFMFPLSLERLSTLSHPSLVWEDAEKLVHGRSDLPGEYRIYYNLGTIYERMGLHDKAIANLKRSIELSPDLNSAYNNLGAAYFQQGKLKESLSSFNRAIQISMDEKLPPNPRFYFGRARTYEALGDVEAARNDYEVSCRLAAKGCEKVEKK